METSPVATGVPLCTDAQAAQIDAKIAEEVPSYSPGKFIESAKFFNDVKARLDAKNPGDAKKFISIFSRGWPTEGLEKSSREELKAAAEEHRKTGIMSDIQKEARELLEGEPDLQERFDALMAPASAA